MLDIEKFIVEVKRRPALYDTKLKEYANKVVKANCWVEVGRAMYANWDEMSVDEKDNAGKVLLKRWKTLRDAFVKEYKSTKKVEAGGSSVKKKRYMFYENLSFLVPHVKGYENTLSNIISADYVPQYDDEEQQPAVDEPEDNFQKDTNSVISSIIVEQKPKKERSVRKHRRAKTLSSSSNKMASLVHDFVALQKSDMTADRDKDRYGHMSFLMSFVPIMNSMPPFEAMEIRMKITEVFRDALRPQPHRPQPQDHESRASTPNSGM